MSKRYDYRREYMNMTAQELREARQRLMDGWAKSVSDKMDADYMKRVSYIDAKLNAQ